MKVTYILRDNGACGYYRMDLPLSTMGKKTDHKVCKIEKGDNAGHIEKCIDGADVIGIPRPSEEEVLHTINGFKKFAKVFVEFDDDLFTVSPLSPHYEEWGTKNVQIPIDGEMKPVWTDGENIDLKANINRLDNIKRACEMADAITVTTDKLAEVYGQFGDVKVLPNCVDMELWKKLPLKNEEVRLFWAGGSSHYEDWMILSDVLPTIMEKYKNVKLVLMGSKFQGTLRRCPQDRIEFHNWVHTQAYPYKVRILNPDICLIPLQDNNFNRGKSAIKWIEMGAMGVPSVVSHVTPYKEVYNGHNSVSVDNDTKAWVEAISTLIEEPMVRWNIGGEAYKTVQQNFDINTQYVQWERFCEELNGNK